MFKFRWAVVVGFCLVLLGLSPTVRAADEKLDIKASTNCDPNLFATRLIATVHNRVARAPRTVDVDNLLDVSMQELKELKETMTAANKAAPVTAPVFQPEVFKMCDNTIAMIDHTNKLRKKLSEIEDSGDYAKRKTKETIAEDAPGLLTDAMTSGSWEAAIAAGLVHGLYYGGAYVWYSVTGDSKKSDEVNSVLEELGRVPLENVENNKAIVEACAKLYSPKRAEWGYDVTDDENKMISGDVSPDKRIAVFDAWRKRRPRDPFAAVDCCIARGCEAELPVARLRELSDTCLEASRQVPDIEAFNKYKLTCLLKAGELANRAASFEAFQSKKGRFGGNCESAADAVKVWNTVLTLTKDPTGLVRMRKGIALAMSGHLADGQALLTEVAELRDKAKCPIFAYNYAAICTLNGNVDTAMDWLKAGFSRCGLNHNDWKLIQNDADFAALREKYAEDLRKIDPEK